MSLVKATAKEAMVDAVLANLDATFCASWLCRVVGTQIAGKSFVAIAAVAARCLNFGVGIFAVSGGRCVRRVDAALCMCALRGLGWCCFAYHVGSSVLGSSWVEPPSFPVGVLREVGQLKLVSATSTCHWALAPVAMSMFNAFRAVEYAGSVASCATGRVCNHGLELRDFLYELPLLSVPR